MRKLAPLILVLFVACAQKPVHQAHGDPVTFDGKRYVPVDAGAPMRAAMTANETMLPALITGVSAPAGGPYYLELEVVYEGRTRSRLVEFKDRDLFQRLAFKKTLPCVHAESWFTVQPHTWQTTPIPWSKHGPTLLDDGVTPINVLECSR